MLPLWWQVYCSSSVLAAGPLDADDVVEVSPVAVPLAPMFASR